MEVVMGKKNVKFFFWIYISPGRRPNQESLPPTDNKAPTIIRSAPNTIIILPNDPIALNFTL